MHTVKLSVGSASGSDAGAAPRSIAGASPDSRIGNGLGGLASVIAREREIAARALSGDALYHGTIAPLALGTRLIVERTAGTDLDAVRDPGRPAGMERRAGAVSVASSIRDAAVITTIRLERERTVNAYTELFVYRVKAEPFHAGPLAVIEELRGRIQARGPMEALIREYWQPTGIWHIREVLVPSLVVIEEVAPPSEREAYVPRWVLYREDAERARSL